MALAGAIVRGECSASAMDALQEKGLADVNWQDKEGRTALHYAASYGATDAFDWLVRHGADIEARQQDGSNVLHAAAVEGQCSVITWLDTQGKRDVLERLLSETVDGLNPHRLALNNGHSDFARQLEPFLQPQGRTGGGASSGGLSLDLPTPPPPPTVSAERSHEAMASGSEWPSPMPPAPPPTEQTAASRRSAGGQPQQKGGGAGSGVPCTGFSVSAAWSVAGVGTCIQVTHRSFGLHVAFDMGTSAAEALDADHVFISHSHIDHIGALLSHARARTLGNKPARYYVPEEAVEPLMKAKEAFDALDHSTIKADIRAVKPGDSFRVHPNVRAVVFATTHRVPSQGYMLIRDKSKGLKPEYRDLAPRELGALRKQGIQVVDMEEVVELTYTGDTTFEALLPPSAQAAEEDSRVPRPLSARLVVVECTYLEAEDREAADKYQHVHLEDVVRHAGALEGVEQLVLCHVSRKYGPASRILRLLQAALPPSLLSRTCVTLAGFGRPEPVTSLEAAMQEDLLLANDTQPSQATA